MTFNPDVSSPLSSGVFSGAEVWLRSHLSRAVGWWCWVWCLAAGTGVSCPGLGTGREAWTSRVSSEALDSLPLVKWDTRTWLRLGLAEKGWAQVFRTSAYRFNHSRLSLWKKRLSVCWVCVLPRSLQPVWRRYILLPLPLEGFLGHWTALTSERERTVINPFTQGWKKWLSRHLTHRVVCFISKTCCINQLQRVMIKIPRPMKN